MPSLGAVVEECVRREQRCRAGVAQGPSATWKLDPSLADASVRPTEGGVCPRVWLLDAGPGQAELPRPCSSPADDFTHRLHGPVRCSPISRRSR